VNVPHYLQHVQPLLQTAHWEKAVHQRQAELLVGKGLHVAVSAPVVQGHRRQVVKVAIQVVGHFVFDVDDEAQDSERGQVEEWSEQPRVGRLGVDCLHVRQVLGVHMEA
jgi:hypothetical protein